MVSHARRSPRLARSTSSASSSGRSTTAGSTPVRGSEFPHQPRTAAGDSSCTPSRLRSVPRLVGINHIALEVGDLEQALEWYGRIFEFELVREPDFPHMAFLQ